MYSLDYKQPKKLHSIRSVPFRFFTHLCIVISNKHNQGNTLQVNYYFHNLKLNIFITQLLERHSQPPWTEDRAGLEIILKQIVRA
jgi:hypothetical protein